MTALRSPFAATAAEPFTADQANMLAGHLKVLADPTRLQILSLLAAADGGEATGKDLRDALGLAQPTIASALKVLEGAGLIVRRRDGVFVRQRVDDDAVAELAGALRGAR